MDAGDLNGGALQSFVVNWNGGSQNCPAVTNCRVTGLQNNVDYSFTVSAVTEAGTSDPSAPATARPDAKPNQPAVPTTKFGDRVIDLSWPATTVPDGGSPVTQYKIQVSPGINGQTEFTTAGHRVAGDGPQQRHRIPVPHPGTQPLRGGQCRSRVRILVERLFGP